MQLKVRGIRHFGAHQPDTLLQDASDETNSPREAVQARDDDFIQSLISANELKKREKQIKNEQANHEFEQLLLKFD